MSNPPPVSSYQTRTPNFGIYAANVSWLAPLAALLVLATVFFFNPPAILAGAAGVVLWIIGLVSGVVALSSERRYGRNGIRGPAIIGLSITLAMLLLLLVIGCVVILFLGGLAALKRPWGNFI